MQLMSESGTNCCFRHAESIQSESNRSSDFRCIKSRQCTSNMNSCVISSPISWKTPPETRIRRFPFTSQNFCLHANFLEKLFEMISLKVSFMQELSKLSECCSKSFQEISAESVRGRCIGSHLRPMQLMSESGTNCCFRHAESIQSESNRRSDFRCIKSCQRTSNINSCVVLKAGF
ncbi:hypothetical protein CDAR_49451 [Caerostris darwini]|uniref:Uncharacterized protein n=1 Tax=Caerostris darwini TaxID=1538125 RepID=A0AAV4Q839_9ARAC|nr:hypothetical protein CDAR_49451 [Caerostris darwini]